jgi:hypothetical protein
MKIARLVRRNQGPLVHFTHPSRFLPGTRSSQGPTAPVCHGTGAVTFERGPSRDVLPDDTRRAQSALATPIRHFQSERGMPDSGLGAQTVVDAQKPSPTTMEQRPSGNQAADVESATLAALACSLLHYAVSARRPADRSDTPSRGYEARANKPARG